MLALKYQHHGSVMGYNMGYKLVNEDHPIYLVGGLW
jgi:hypothetical protein